MSENKESFRIGADDTVPTRTLAAVFAMSVVMGLVVVSGVLNKPYEAKTVVKDLHQRILLEKEMRELRDMDYGQAVVSYSRVPVVQGADYSDVIQSIKPMRIAQKTDRAQEFERDVRSDDYWASLQDSVSGATPVPSTPPIVIPPVIIGSAE